MTAALCDHFGSTLAGQTLQWSGMDTLQRFRQNLSQEDSRQRLQDLGWIQPGSIQYSYNSHGFRCSEFDTHACGIALGGSITEGCGVKIEQTWHQVLSSILDIKIWNLGIPACAMDTCYRVLEAYIDHLKPKFVALCTPPMGRFEMMSHHGGWEIFGLHMGESRHDNYVKEWLVSDCNSQTNSTKNLLAMQHICAQRSVDFYWVDGTGANDCAARDLCHPGPLSHKWYANEIYKQMRASNEY